MSKYVINESTLTSIGDAIRAKGGTSDLILVSDLAKAITNLPSGDSPGGGGGGDASLPTELTVSGDYWDNTGAWDWYFEAVPSANITFTGADAKYAFSGCKLEDLSHLHITVNNADINKNYMFDSCKYLKALPVIDWKYSASLFNSDYVGYMFSGCYRLRNIPADFFKMTDENGNKTNEFCFSNSHGNGNGVFENCYSLRKLPDLPKTWYFNNQQNVYKNCYCSFCCKLSQK